MTDLSPQALATLAEHNVVPAAFIAHYNDGGDTWHGDTCGCADDRCIGYHHEGADGCGCLEPWIDEFLKTIDRVVVGFNPDSEHWWTDGDEFLDTDLAYVHLVNAPRDLWARHQEAAKVYEATLAELVALTGADPETGIASVPCPRWDGDEIEGREWWSVQIPASGSDDVWPAGNHPVDIGPHHATAGEATAWLRQLPESFHLLTVSGTQVRLIERADLSIAARSLPIYVSPCHRCEHPRDAHADAGTSRGDR